MSLYHDGLAALEHWKLENKLPAKYDENVPILVRVNEQIDCYEAELVEDLEQTQKTLDEIVEFREEWRKVL